MGLKRIYPKIAVEEDVLYIDKGSERTFLRHFQEGVGMTPMGWLQRERMFRARELLDSTDFPLTDVAEQCGYQSLETFRVAFKRIIGTSPAAYRSRFNRSQPRTGAKAHCRSRVTTDGPRMKPPRQLDPSKRKERKERP